METGLSAGTYNITVTDGSGCTVGASATITEPAAIILATSTTDKNCGSLNGTASVSVSGGTSPYAYLWNDTNGQTDSTATGLSTGSYTVTVTDDNGCTTDTSVALSNINDLTILASSTDISCNGYNDVTPTGGPSPFTYNWSPSGGTDSTATGLSAGTYNITVTDGSGCTVNTSVTITEPAIMVIDIKGDTIICEGNSTTITASLIDTTGVSNYLWNTGSRSQSIQVNPSSSTVYSVTVTNSGCSSTDSIEVIVNPLPTVDAGNDTTITLGEEIQLNGMGGQAYIWNPPTGGLSCTICQDPIATPTASTTYSLTVTDSNRLQHIWISLQLHLTLLQRYLFPMFSPPMKMVKMIKTSLMTNSLMQLKLKTIQKRAN